MPLPVSSIARHSLAAAALGGLFVFAACGNDGPTEPDTPAPEITTTEMPDATIGESYSEAIAVNGGNGEYFWDIIEGGLPRGLTFSVDDLTPEESFVTGIPERVTEAFFRVRVEDGLGRADTTTLSITVNPEPVNIVVESPRIPPGLVGWPYNVELTASGGDHSTFEWTVVAGSLPAGLELTSDGRFEGSPAAADTTTFTVQVSSGGFTVRQTYTLPVVPERTDGYAITAFNVVELDPNLQDNVDEAIRRWEAAITGDLETGTIPAGEEAFFEPGQCGGFGQLVNGTTVDDVLILVNIDSIDGPGDVLGRAGPCGLRGDLSPFVGILTLDEADLLGMANHTATHIIQHEIAHVLGFGTLWDPRWFDVLIGAEGTDPRYTGEAAVAVYQTVVDTATTIPVENMGGEGTRDSHWRESVFDNELMTGFAESNMFLSAMTIASFEDLGYQVDRSAADSDPLLSLMGALYDVDGELRNLGHDIAGVPGPIVILYPDGSRREIRPRVDP